MATVNRQIAEQLVARLTKQKQPKVYCIVKYINTSFNNDSYSICYRPYHYDGLFSSPFVGKIDVLWESPRFRKDHPFGPTDDFEDWLMSDEALRLISKPGTREPIAKCTTKHKTKKKK